MEWIKTVFHICGGVGGLLFLVMTSIRFCLLTWTDWYNPDACMDVDEDTPVPLRYRLMQLAGLVIIKNGRVWPRFS